MPAWLIVDLWRRRFKSKVAWLASVLGFGAYIFYIFLAGGAWHLVSYYLRVAVPVAFACAIYVSFRRVFRAGVPWWRSPGSVERGAEVEDGKVVGKVGNSGNTSEPHLHVHAVRTGSGKILEGEGVPIEFDGRFLVRSSLVFRG